jgi:hypothetical protein
MRRHRTGTVLVWLLGVALIALVWVVYAEISALVTDGDPEAGDATPPSLPAPKAVPPPFAMPDEASLTAILERPVFSESRRPSGGPDDRKTTQTDFTLAGVVISARERSALIHPTQGRVIQRLKEGDDIGGWMLVEIALDRIKVRRGAVETEILIDYAASPPPGPRTEVRKPKPAKNQKPEKQPPAQPGEAQAELEEEIQ